MKEKNVYEEEVKWAKHYSSMHQILLVGEGDFSFSLSLANAFGSAINIVATSHDSYDILLRKYSKAQSNVEKLKRMGAAIIHEVDATNMKFHVGLWTRKFDRIVFNFPHAGFKGKEAHPDLIRLHRELVWGFFRNASCMLRPYGEVHVSHKTASPFSDWNLEELASNNLLTLVECVDFYIEDYPGYNNKRGDGSKSDHSFPLGKCSTFKFIIENLRKRKQPLRKTDLLLASPSISPIMVNHFGYRNPAINHVQSADIVDRQMHFPVNLERIPRGITTLPSMTEINGLEFRDTTLPILSRINTLGLRMHELEYSTFPGVSLRSREALRSFYEAEQIEAPRRVEALGYSYIRQLEVLHSRNVSSLESYRRILVRQAQCDEETHVRQLILSYGR